MSDQQSHCTACSECCHGDISDEMVERAQRAAYQYLRDTGRGKRQIWEAILTVFGYRLPIYDDIDAMVFYALKAALGRSELIDNVAEHRAKNG